MFTIQKANLAANGEFQEQSIKAAGLTDKTVKLASTRKGLNFFDADGSLFCYAKFSKSVIKAIVEKTLTIEQLLAKGRISASDYEGETYYFLTLPEELRGGASLGTVKEIAAKAKPLAKKAATLADISSMLSLD